MLLDSPPLAQLDIYAHVTVLTRRDGLGWRSYLVSSEDVARILARTPVASGLLTPETIGAGFLQGQPFTITYLAPQAITFVTTIHGQDVTQHIQSPPLIWAGWRQAYRLFACRAADVGAWPTSAAIPLCHAPFPNVFPDGAICWGDGPRPGPARAATMQATFAIFLHGSRFNDHLAQQKSRRWIANVALAYAALSPETPYPDADLLPTGTTLGHVLAGRCWNAYADAD